MSDQLSFASLDYAAKRKRTKRDVFLAEMATIVPWGALEALIDPQIRRWDSRAAADLSRFRRCCASSACSIGTASPIRAPRRRSMISKPQTVERAIQRFLSNRAGGSADWDLTFSSACDRSLARVSKEQTKAKIEWPSMSHRH